MTDIIAGVFLVAALAIGLLLVPFSLPGLWVMVGGILGYGLMTDMRSVTVAVIAIVVGLAFVGEVLEHWLGFKFAKRYGASRRAGWGALIGGLVGAIVGIPVPVVGSVLGAFIGSFVGAALFEYTSARRAGAAARAGWGAVLGRAAAAGAKCGLGVVIGVIGLYVMVAP